MRNSIVIAILAAAGCQLSTAQPLSLEDCKALARENNIALRTAATNLEMAEQQKKEAFTNYFPTISAMGMGFEANKDLIELNMMGMELGMVKNGLYAGVTAVQPVFAGGQIVNSNRLAQTGVEASKLQLRQSQNEVELTTERYYWNVVSLQEKLKTLDILGQMLRSTDKDVSALVDAGMTTRNDLLQVQLRENEVESQRTKAANALKIGKMLLAQHIGSDLGEQIDVASDIDIGTMPDFPLEMKLDHGTALGQTSEYQLLEKNVEAKKLEKRIEVGKNMPSIGVGAGYSYNNWLDKDMNRGMIFATVSVPLSSWWGGSHAIRRKKLAEDDARDQLEDNAELLVIRMENAWTQVENAYKQLSLQRKSIEQAEENLRLNTDMYQAGTSTMTELMQAQSLYQQARDGYVDAYVSLQLAKTEYLHATGR